jgi:hypothetical protein
MMRCALTSASSPSPPAYPISAIAQGLPLPSPARLLPPCPARPHLAARHGPHGGLEPRGRHQHQPAQRLHLRTWAGAMEGGRGRRRAVSSCRHAAPPCTRRRPSPRRTTLKPEAKYMPMRPPYWCAPSCSRAHTHTHIAQRCQGCAGRLWCSPAAGAAVSGPRDCTRAQRRLHRTRVNATRTNIPAARPPSVPPGTAGTRCAATPAAPWLQRTRAGQGRASAAGPGGPTCVSPALRVPLLCPSVVSLTVHELDRVVDVQEEALRGAGEQAGSGAR